MSRSRRMIFPDPQSLRDLIGPDDSITVGYDLFSDNIRVDIWSAPPDLAVHSRTIPGTAFRQAHICLITSTVELMMTDIKRHRRNKFTFDHLVSPPTMVGPEYVVPFSSEMAKRVAKARLEHEEALLSKMLEEWNKHYRGQEPNVLYSKSDGTVLGLTLVTDPNNIVVKRPATSPTKIDIGVRFDPVS